MRERQCHRASRSKAIRRSKAGRRVPSPPAPALSLLAVACPKGLVPIPRNTSEKASEQSPNPNWEFTHIGEGPGGVEGGVRRRAHGPPPPTPTPPTPLHTIAVENSFKYKWFPSNQKAYVSAAGCNAWVSTKMTGGCWDKKDKGVYEGYATTRVEVGRASQCVGGGWGARACVRASEGGRGRAASQASDVTAPSPPLLLGAAAVLRQRRQVHIAPLVHQGEGGGVNDWGGLWGMVGGWGGVCARSPAPLPTPTRPPLTAPTPPTPPSPSCFAPQAQMLGRKQCPWPQLLSVTLT